MLAGSRRLIHAAGGWDPRLTQIAGLIRNSIGLPTRGTVPSTLTGREERLFAATSRRAIRAATSLAGVTVIILAAANGLGMLLLFTQHQAVLLAITGAEAAVGFGIASLAVRRRWLPAVLLALLLMWSMVVTMTLLLVFIPESRLASLMLLAALPPAVALFMPWSPLLQCGWLLASAAVLATLHASPLGAQVADTDWVSAGLILVITGAASVVGRAASNSGRREVFLQRMQARREHAQTVVDGVELRRLNVLLAAATRTDHLTGLGNRLRLNEELDAAVARLRRFGTACALVMLDLDHFKAFNDALGHQAGDAALQAVGAALSGTLRRTDAICRYGGEEIVVLLPEQDLVAAVQAAERMRRAVADLDLRYPTQQGEAQLTVSAGVAALRGTTTEDADAALGAADRALYRAKHRGRNKVASERGGTQGRSRPSPNSRRDQGEEQSAPSRSLGGPSASGRQIPGG